MSFKTVPADELEQLAIAIAKVRPQNNFITGPRIEWGWVAQPDYRHVWKSR